MIIFRDRLTAYHKEQETQEDGSTQEKRADTPFVNAIACQVSHEDNDKGTPKGRDRLPQARDMKVFVWLDRLPKGERFKRGDFISFDRLDDAGNVITHHEGTIGEPRVYTRGIAHAELSLEAEA